MFDESETPSGKVTITVTFQCEDEEKDYITENLTRLIQRRLEQWPTSAWDERISVEWAKD